MPGEVFALRKLLPQQPQYDFNIHVMDFQPGESLYVKVRFPLMVPFHASNAACMASGADAMS